MFPSISLPPPPPPPDRFYHSGLYLAVEGLTPTTLATEYCLLGSSSAQVSESECTPTSRSVNLLDSLLDLLRGNGGGKESGMRGTRERRNLRPLSVVLCDGMSVLGRISLNEQRVEKCRRRRQMRGGGVLEKGVSSLAPWFGLFLAGV